VYGECGGSKGGIYLHELFEHSHSLSYLFLPADSWLYIQLSLISPGTSFTKLSLRCHHQNLNMHPPQPLLLPIILTIALAAHITPPPLPFATPKPLSAHHKYPTFPPSQVLALAGRIMAKPGRLSQLQPLMDNRCECTDGLKCCGSYCECDIACGEEVKEWECLI
jgi:hypothetical protein